MKGGKSEVFWSVSNGNSGCGLASMLRADRDLGGKAFRAVTLLYMFHTTSNKKTEINHGFNNNFYW